MLGTKKEVEVIVSPKYGTTKDELVANVLHNTQVGGKVVRVRPRRKFSGCNTDEH